MNWFYKIAFLIALVGLFATSTFRTWISGVSDMIDSINSGFWSYLPWEFQICAIGLISCIIVGIVYGLIRK